MVKRKGSSLRAERGPTSPLFDVGPVQDYIAAARRDGEI
jgi:hypothetical protein